MRRRVALRRVAWLAGGAFAAAALNAAQAQIIVTSPEMVKSGLSALDQVAAESGELIAAGNYDELARESERLDAGLASLESGIAAPPAQPSQSRAMLDLLIAKSRVAASAMGEAARTHNTSMVRVTTSQLVAAVKAIVALFPQELRPVHAPPAR
ncbi:MAG TPA: hypothetical protein VMU67_04615 [Steroidobacteraceae bacterium]|nr:hypothetical protein [Steroidobacteraceae bacterium]